MKTEVIRAPMVYVFLVCFFTIIVAWMIYKYSSIRCGDPNCLGLRKAAEFHIQIETEDCVKKSSSSSSVVKEGSGGKGLLQLSIDRHRELEAELRKIAPPNGRDVLVFIFIFVRKPEVKYESKQVYEQTLRVTLQ
ncbi:hypothetical protein MKX01_012362 [Papaver californicum]|nr:hypothetical protein MKX01_012362 [Papaver californicum]